MELNHPRGFRQWKKKPEEAAGLSEGYVSLTSPGVASGEQRIWGAVESSSLRFKDIKNEMY